jgi:ATP-dependent Clp protease protease subunit
MDEEDDGPKATGILIEPQFIGIYDTIDDRSARETVASLLSLLQMSKEILPEEGDSLPPIEFIVSTHGGVAVEMFAIYDVMRLVREQIPLHTLGIGKIMSSGLLLIAAGTKGERRIGKNTRLMFHDVLSTVDGHLHEIQTSINETKAIKNAYIECLADETDLSLKQLKSLINKRKNIYFSAEEAVEWGFADIIV